MPLKHQIGLGPIERAEHDKQRRQMREARRAQARGPGPQSYSPNKGTRGSNATLADMTGEAASAVFASRSTRDKAPSWEPTTIGPGDPGMYNVGKTRTGTNSTIADSRGEFGGSSAFKSTSKQRRHQGLATAAETPGPGPTAYVSRVNGRGRNAELADMRGEAASATFKSNTPARGEIAKATASPGVGAYSPSKLTNGLNAEVSDMRGESASSSMASKTTQFAITDPMVLEAMANPIVGPGSYSLAKTRVGTNSALADMAGEFAGAGFTSSFESGVARTHLPWEQ